MSSSSSNSSFSSSSSSYLDNHDDKTIPFMFESQTISPVWCMAFDGEDVYVGTGSEGKILKSSDREFWSMLYSVADINVTALFVHNRSLYIGTGPEGKIYIMNLDSGPIALLGGIIGYIDNSPILSQQIGGIISYFYYYNKKLYAFISSPSAVYAYNNLSGKWDFVYKPHGNIITNVLPFNNKLYIFMDIGNFISFDGNYWVLETLQNVDSFRSVSLSPYSHSSGSFIDIKNAQGVNLPPEDTFSIVPSQSSFGIKGCAVDGSSLILGSSKYGKVYSYLKDVLYQLFQTESMNTVHSILNLNVGVNLVAIDNKLYLGYCGYLPNNNIINIDQPLTAPTTTTTTTLMKHVNVLYPSGGEVFINGSTMQIIWTSDLGISEAVQIYLYVNGVQERVINDKASNIGSYQWEIPDDVLPSDKYQIALRWMSPSLVTVNDVSVSEKTFTITGVEPTTTTTTTTEIDLQAPNVKSSHFTPVLELINDEYITVMKKDVAKGGVLLGTSTGRILYTDILTMNAYLTGNRVIYAEAKNGFGNKSDTATVSLFYALYNKIMEINNDKEVVKWIFEKDTSTIAVDRISSVFLSDIIYNKESSGIWKQLIWREDKPVNTEIIICVKAANDTSELKSKQWQRCFVSRDSDHQYGSTGTIVRELDDSGIKGKYLQFKVTMTSDKHNVSPTLLNLMISYYTQFSIYFFTTKFMLENNAHLNKGLLVANMTQPQNTEIKFGINSTDSINWADYSIIDPNTFFDLDNLDSVKVGIKMISYNENVPEVAEFALMTGADVNTEINRG